MQECDPSDCQDSCDRERTYVRVEGLDLLHSNITGLDDILDCLSLADRVGAVGLGSDTPVQVSGRERED